MLLRAVLNPRVLHPTSRPPVLSTLLQLAIWTPLSSPLNPATHRLIPTQLFDPLNASTSIRGGGVKQLGGDQAMGGGVGRAGQWSPNRQLEDGRRGAGTTHGV